MFKEIIDRKLEEKNIPEFRTGDVIRVKVLIQEKGSRSAGKKRVQTFEGIVIARKGYKKSNVLVHRTAFGVKMERMFLLFSPEVLSVEVVLYAKFRRSTMYESRKSIGNVKVVESVKRREAYSKNKRKVLQKEKG